MTASLVPSYGTVLGFTEFKKLWRSSILKIFKISVETGTSAFQAIWSILSGVFKLSNTAFLKICTRTSAIYQMDSLLTRNKKVMWIQWNKESSWKTIADEIAKNKERRPKNYLLSSYWQKSSERKANVTKKCCCKC